MKVLVAYYSFTGKSRKLAGEIAGKIGKNASVLEIVPKKKYSSPSVFLVGGYESSTGKIVELEPANVPKFDALVIVNPVWAWTMCPPVKSFLAKLEGNGRKAVGIANQDGKDAKAVEKMAAFLEERGFEVTEKLVVRDEATAKDAVERTAAALKD